jgi:hypothetical protein
MKIRIFSYGKSERDTNCRAVEWDWLTMYFSYQTPVAYKVHQFGQRSRLCVSENVWGRTTGKHLSLIRGECRHHFVVPHDEFEALLRKVLSLLPRMTDELGDELWALMGDEDAAART